MAFRDWPIRQKLTAILLVISGLVLLLTSAAFATYEVLTIRRRTVANLATLGRVLAANSTAALAFANAADAREILSALRAEPHIIAAGLYTQDGRLFTRYPADLPDDALPARPELDGYRFERGYIIGLEPVAEAGNPRLGTLYLKSDLKAVSRTLRLSVAIGASVLAISLLAAYVLAALLQGRISQPITALADAAAAVSARQDYSVRAPKVGADELGALTDAFNQMLGRIEEQERALRAYASELEQRVAERTHELEERNQALRRNAAELSAANTELDAFAYSVSHDLRAPLRSIDGFSQALLEDYGGRLDDAARGHLDRVRAASQRMAQLIDDLLGLSRVTRAELRRERVDLSALAQSVVADLQGRDQERAVEFAIAPDLTADADPDLLRVVLENLLANAWKYTAKRPQPRIEFGLTPHDGKSAFYVRDKGAGFDMMYASKLFGAFQRLQTGIGLATVQRIVHRHGGKVWAEGAVGQGATFYFTL
ncbi:MAG: histidine kinase [Gemmatimonadetes bacterium]|nr:MAG: histidine kinase [Gemmatimonadota bacterium]